MVVMFKDSLNFFRFLEKFHVHISNQNKHMKNHLRPLKDDKICGLDNLEYR